MFKKAFLLAFSLIILIGCSMPNAGQTALPKTGEQIVVFETDHGTMKFRLFPETVPETYKNFVYHVEEGNYDNTNFHRVIKDFMIQGGDIDGLNGIGGYSYNGPGTSIAEEISADLTHVPGALSMANTGLPNSTGSQFFIVQSEEGAHWLDGKHSVFGQLIEGMDVVNEIASVQVSPGNAKPIEDVILLKAYLTEYEG